VAGVVDAETFARETNSTRWAGTDSWERWYQPIIDAALEHEGRVVAANAPRRYVRAARTLGYDALRELDPAQRALFDLPIEPIGDRYRAEFFDLMGGGLHGETMSDEQVQPIFDSQCVWDATMGASVANAEPGAARKVMLLVGRFHIDHDGGTLQQLRHRLPGVRVLSVTCVDSSEPQVAEEDRGRAQVVVHVGA
ncbi:MAG: ChaN family lipoprotein, partial [Planctomycetota bacterium]